MKALERLDGFQQRHRKLSVPIAVLLKYGDDQGGYLAALITYYGFLSLFPLLLLLSTVLNFVLDGDPGLQHRILDSALGQFPIVGDQLSSGDHVSGSGIALVIGILGTLYGGLGVAQAAQNAMNTAWQVPRNERPNALKQRLRSLLLLVVIGLSILGTTILSALGTSASAYGASIGHGFQAVLIGVSFVLNVMIFVLAFRFATARTFVLRDHLPGAVSAAVAWQLLQWFGTAYVGHVVKNATVTNSVFALVLGLIAWIYLESVVVVMSVEYNVVRALHLYPRSLNAKVDGDAPLGQADKRTYASRAKAERADDDQHINVEFKHNS